MNPYRFTSPAINSILVFVGSIVMVAFLRWVVGPMLRANSNTTHIEPAILRHGLYLLAGVMILTAVGSVIAVVAYLLPHAPKDR